MKYYTKELNPIPSLYLQPQNDIGKGIIFQR